MYFKENKGVTLMALTITIIVMLIITSTIIYNTNRHIRIEKINKLYNDIENISNKIEDYYLKYGEIPTIGNVYCDKTGLNDLLSNNANAQNATLKTTSDVAINPNDGDEYYIIDLEKLEGLTLNYGYGDDYTKVKGFKDTPENITTELDEVYIINKTTHQIYYPSGVFEDDIMYYTYNMNSTKATNEYNISAKDGEFSFQNENVIKVNSFKIYGNSKQDVDTYGDPSPDNPVEIESVGDLVKEGDNDYSEHGGSYRIPVTVSGKNLFDVSKSSGFTSKYPGLTNTIDGNTITVNSSAEGRGGYLTLGNFEPGIYYISANFITGMFKCFITLNDEVLNTVKYYIENGQGTIITISDTTKIGLYYSFSKDKVCKISEIQITKSNVPTEYEPYYKVTSNIYLKEPLRKVGDNTADYIDLLNKKVIRTVRQAILNGSEEWFNNSSLTTIGTYSANLVTKIGTNYGKIKCSCLPRIGKPSLSSVDEKSGIFSGQNLVAVINKNDLNLESNLAEEAITKWKEYLAEHNMEVLYTTNSEYSLDDEVISDIEFKDGINYITIGTETTPSEIELSYYEINK